MNIPKTIKIGGRNIKVVIDKRTGKDGFNGTTWTDSGVVFLDETNCSELQDITFLHEILHIIFHQLDFERVKFDNDEAQVEWLCKTLSNHLCQVLKDNDLIK